VTQEHTCYRETDEKLYFSEVFRQCPLVFLVKRGQS
jgi:hypothetical protein